MNLLQWIVIDIKRLFRGYGPVLAALLTPLVGLIVFASVAVPMLAINRDIRVPYALCNEDKSVPVNQFISVLVNSEAMGDLGTAYPINDIEVGYRMLRERRVGVLVHVEPDFYEIMDAGGNPTIKLVAYPNHRFEQIMVDIALDSSLRTMGQRQNILQAVRTALIEAGSDEALTDAMIDAEVSNAIEQYMHRRAALGHKGALSPVGDMLPLEYYLSALFSLFAAMAMLPALSLTATDMSGAVCRRGLLSDKKTVVKFYLSRLLSGASLILLTLLLLLPAGGLIRSLNIFWGNGGGLMWPALAAALTVISLGFSAFSIFLASLIRQPRLAVWSGFVIILVMAALSGALVAEGKLPQLLSDMGRLTVLKPAMNLIANVLFSLDMARYVQDVLRLLLMSAIFSVSSFVLIYRRGGAK